MFNTFYVKYIFNKYKHFYLLKMNYISNKKRKKTIRILKKYIKNNIKYAALNGKSSVLISMSIKILITKMNEDMVYSSDIKKHLNVITKWLISRNFDVKVSEHYLVIKW